MEITRPKDHPSHFALTYGRGAVAYPSPEWDGLLEKLMLATGVNL